VEQTLGRVEPSALEDRQQDEEELGGRQRIVERVVGSFDGDVVPARYGRE